MKRFDKQKLFENYINEYGLNLFLGAGFSVMATNKYGETLPLGKEINERLIDYFELDKNRGFSLSQTCQKIRNSKSDALDMFLKDVYNVEKYNPLYGALTRVPVKNIITTNIDNLIEKIYDNSKLFKLSDTSINGELLKKNFVSLYKIHGSVTYPTNKELLFSVEELNSLFLNNKPIFDTVSYKLASMPTLFWGTGVLEGNILQLIIKSKYFNNYNLEKWVVIYSDKTNDSVIGDYEDMGFNIILSDTKEMLEYLDGLKLVDVGKIKDNDYEIYFPNNFVSDNLINKSFKRPVVEFFSGAEPIISDIVSANVVKTKYYGELLNKIIGGDKTMITGTPGSGKSTLLMQLAFSNDITGIKFWFDSIIKEEAEKLVKIVNNDGQVYVFVDNLYNNAEAVDVLSKSKNINLIVAERQLNYEYVKRILNFSNDRVVDISDLNDNDIQRICRAMNKPNLSALKLIENNENISLFEIVYYVNKSYLILDRIKEYVKELRNYNEINLKLNLLELFTLINYTSYCGVPCSMDMLFFYYSSSDIKYNDILYALSKMNKIIVETENDIEFDKSQDYLAVRSKLFAEKSLFEIDKETLGKVLSKVLENVSQEIICRYDVFKKKAYDADLTVRAFSKKEGIEFYEKILVNNKSPYVRHQYAIFLQRKLDYTLSWKQIDQAYTDSNQKIFTIANTHAIITFEKNILSTVPDNQIGILKETIKRSFDTLEYCIDKDVRVNYHILVYARNAIKYFEKYGKDEFSSHYISVAINQIQLLFNSKDYIFYKTKRELRELLDNLIRINNQLL